MPFVKVDIKKEIQQLRDSDAAFKEAWDNSRQEYRILGEITKLRNLHGMSQTDLADAAGIKQQVVSRIENRENSPTLKTFCAIVEALGMEINIVPKH